MKLSDQEWEDLEKIFWHDIGTEEEYEKEYGQDLPLGRFFRSLTGLSPEAAEAAFADFLDAKLYTGAQIHFVKCIVEWIEKYGTLQRSDLQNTEFTGGDDIVDIFADNMDGFNKIMIAVDMVNANAMKKAA